MWGAVTWKRAFNLYSAIRFVQAEILSGVEEKTNDEYSKAHDATSSRIQFRFVLGKPLRSRRQ